MTQITASSLSILVAITAGFIIGYSVSPFSVPVAVISCIVLGIVCGSYLPNKLVKVTAPRK